MERTILHVDINNCYASIECLHRPHLRELPVAVGGDPLERHGIVLAKNQLAKQYGVKTGDALWQARQKCPALVIVPPDYPLYLRFSKLARDIYTDYTDRVEAFGIDECWLDVTGCNGEIIAEEIRQRVAFELGITVSIGVSFNKIFAKLGSDYKKPNAVTAITRDNFKSIAWQSPASDLLYVGSATARKLHSRGVHTIGELAQTAPELLHSWFGKIGGVLWTFANGLDRMPVARFDALTMIKSIGNSTTTPRDLEDDEDVKMILFVLAGSVAARMREQGFSGRTVSISVRDSLLASFTRQTTLSHPSCLESEIASAAFTLFCRCYRWANPIRSIGLSVTDFSHAGAPVQLDMFDDFSRREQRHALETAVDDLRRRFGNGCVQRAVLLKDTRLTGFDPKRDHIIHPVGYL